jgi:hypothetical protein
VNFCLVVLSFHEYIQELLGCLEAEYLGKITAFVVEIVIEVIN